MLAVAAAAAAVSTVAVQSAHTTVDLATLAAAGPDGLLNPTESCLPLLLLLPHAVSTHHCGPRNIWHLH
jgi:hypothetical protein